jgi:DNA-binding NtrC family response regulator
MKIVIVESELYLAQSIAAKLSEANFEAETYSSIKEALASHGDVYLLSTSISGQSCLPVVKKFKDKIVILMVNYINNDTVGEPMRHGAQDYIVKPFMIEDLIRKIEYHRKVCLLEKNNAFYEKYIDNILGKISCSEIPGKLAPPVIFHTNYQRAADKMALKVSKERGLPLVLISFEEKDWKEQITNSTKQNISYLVGFEKLKQGDRVKLFELLKGKLFILSTTEEIENAPFDVVKIETTDKLYDQNEILTIDEYVQYMVKSFQYKLPDTALSKKLGISRKSLWEKRKKYDLFKKK